MQNRLFGRVSNVGTNGNRQRSLSLENLEARHLLAADIGVANPFEMDAVTVDDVAQRAAQEPYVPGQLIVATSVPTGKAEADQFVRNINWSGLAGVNDVEPLKTLLTMEQAPRESVSLVQLDLGAGTDLMAAMRKLDQDPNVLWSQPNFVFAGEDPRDLIPNDPDFGSQYHHPLIGNVDAWDVSLGDSNIVIGITDDGVDIQHEDLSTTIWTNAGETPGDGIDNDGNGYVDDVNGYNFLNNNNNPDALAGDSHGTHVAGIAGATINNNIGTVGTAPGVTILPLKWYDGGTWTAAIIAETFTYATDNGADIVNTSYNMDGWANDAVVHAAFDYMYDAGVLHFNSAGNGGALNPARQVFVESLLTVSTNSSDVKAGSSNYGTGVDISAPGDGVLSTTPNNSYSVFSGTSMAAPNAAGAAALIWSANPSWSREQVVAQLFATADNIDGSNPSFAGLMGSGRINTFNALTQTIGAPQIESLVGLPANGGVLTQPLAGFDVRFTQVMDPASVNDANSYELRSAGFDGVFDTADDDLVSLTLNDTYKIGTNQYSVDITNGNLGFGEYRLTLASGGLQNPFGTGLDGDGNGTGGDNFETFFSVEPPAPVAIEALGSLIYTQSFPDAIDGAADTDLFGVELDAGQSLTVIIEGASGLTPTVQVEDPDGVMLASAAATGSDVVAQVISVDTPGQYVVNVGGAGDSTGGYQVTYLLNAFAEAESFGGGENNSLANAENIDASALPLGSGLTEGGATAERLAVVGRLPSSDGTPVDGEDFETGALDSRWTTSSSNPLGRIQVTGNYGTAGGNFGLIMDVSQDSNDNRNEAIWTADLTGVASPKLSFYHAEWGDEETALPQSFTGSVDGDGVSISDDGVNWYRVFNPTTQSAGQWVKQTIDLTTAASNAGMTLDANFQVKFQQFDNFALDTDGRGYDEILITTPDIADDWYEFSLDDGDVVTLAATAGGGLLELELYDDGGMLLASGVGADNITSVINNFQDTTNDGGATSYYARLSGEDADYSLVVTRNIAFDTEANDSQGSAQSIAGLQGVLGYVASETMGDIEPDAYNSGDVLNNVQSGVTLSNNVGGGSVFAATASFGAPTGSLVLAPGPTSAAGWSDDADEFRADFDTPTSFVSIDVGSDDSSDVAFLRAYASDGTLLDEVVSGSVSTGGSQTISISRPSADIAYIISAGLGTDITPLDNLVYGAPGSDDYYSLPAAAGDDLSFEAFLPAGGPLLFENPLAGPGGSNLLMELLDPSGSVVASDSQLITHTAATNGDYALRVTTADARGEYFISSSPTLVVVDGDFNDDGNYDCADIDALVADIAAGNNDAQYDLSGDGLVDTDDLDLWLAEAGAVNLPSGNPYLAGDANLDGTVDGADFLVWNSNKFTPVAAWCSGDFNADGTVDGGDFLVWNSNKFNSSLIAPPTAPAEIDRLDVTETAGAGLVTTNELRVQQATPAVRYQVASYDLNGGQTEERTEREVEVRSIDELFAQL
ncbi:MAG: S8 family serine peptidase [Planctomycetota bacterium]